jgi:uncharacterized RDD family membrane protein YckC
VPEIISEDQVYFKKRIYAFLIDTIPLVIISIFVPIIGFFLSMSYFLLKDGLPVFGNRSLGKKIMNLEIIRRHSGYNTSIIRNVVLLIPGIIFLELYLIYKNRYHSRLGDKLAGSRIILTEPAENEGV